jgi:hypothetical protein
MTEVWKPVVGFEGSYEVSDLGRVRSVDRSWWQKSRHGNLYLHHKKGTLLRPGSMPGGHLSVALGRGNSHCVHELVLRAFLGPPPPQCEARHLDGNEKNNSFENLVWDTRGNNTRDKKWHRGTASYKLKPDEIASIKSSLQRPYYGMGAELARRFGVSSSAISAIKHDRVHIDVRAL